MIILLQQELQVQLFFFNYIKLKKGGWIKKFIIAACEQKNIIDKNNIEKIEKKFVLCESGPKGFYFSIIIPYTFF